MRETPTVTYTPSVRAFHEKAAADQGANGAGLINEAIARIHANAAQLGDLLTGIQHELDRLLGGLPESEGVKDPQPVRSGGLVGNLHFAVDTLEGLRPAAMQALKRLQEL